MFGADPPRFELGVTANDQSKLGPDGPIGPPEETFAFATIKVSEWMVAVPAWSGKPAVATRGKRVAVKATGWASAGTTLYLHYFRNKKRVHTDKVGPLTGSCGDLARQVKAFAFPSVKRGLYMVRFSADPVWTNQHRWSQFTVRVK